MKLPYRDLVQTTLEGIYAKHAILISRVKFPDQGVQCIYLQKIQSIAYTAGNKSYLGLINRMLLTLLAVDRFSHL